MAKSAAPNRKQARAARVDRRRQTIILRSGREIPLRPQHMPLTKRFPVGLTDKAYRALRKLAAAAGIGNNYTLTVLLENAEKTIDRRAFMQAVARMKTAHAKPAT
jgi:hypothetical protein